MNGSCFLSRSFCVIMLRSFFALPFALRALDSIVLFSGTLLPSLPFLNPSHVILNCVDIVARLLPDVFVVWIEFFCLFLLLVLLSLFFLKSKFILCFYEQFMLLNFFFCFFLLNLIFHLNC